MYSRDQLLELKRVWSQLPEPAVRAIRELGLRRHRGARAGRNKQRPIQVLSSTERFRSRDCCELRPSGCDRDFMNEHRNVNTTADTIRNAQVRLICHAAHSNTPLVYQVHKANPRRCGRAMQTGIVYAAFQRYVALLEVIYVKLMIVVFSLSSHCDIRNQLIGCLHSAVRISVHYHRLNWTSCLQK